MRLFYIMLKEKPRIAFMKNTWQNLWISSIIQFHNQNIFFKLFIPKKSFLKSLFQYYRLLLLWKIFRINFKLFCNIIAKLIKVKNRISIYILDEWFKIEIVKVFNVEILSSQLIKLFLENQFDTFENLFSPSNVELYPQHYSNFITTFLLTIPWFFIQAHFATFPLLSTFIVYPTSYSLNKSMCYMVGL